MKRRFGLQLKFTLLFLGFMLLITVVVLLITEQNNEIIIERRFYDYAVSIGNLASSMITADEVLRYKDTLESDWEYDRTLKELQRIQDQTNIHYLYVIYPISESQGIYIYDTGLEDENLELFGEQTHHLGDVVDLSVGYELAKEAVKTGETGDRFEYEGGMDIEDSLVSAFVPILDQEGNAVAFIGVDMDLNQIWDNISQARNQMMVSMLVVMIGCYFLLILIVRLSMIRRIHSLEDHVEQISSGHFCRPLPVRGHDEISEITDVFNRMSKNIQGHLEEIEEINHAYHKYVPSELLHILGKENITDVRVGDQRNQLVTILRFQLTENQNHISAQTGRQMIEDMNELFQTTIPVIMEQGGYIQSFEDTGMTAVYTNETEGAVLSAISICQNIHLSSIRKNTELPKVSMGIAYGDVLFGITGYEKRMSAVSISTYLSISLSLQKLAVCYGARLLITASAAEQIPNFHTAYHSRFIGMIEHPYSKVVEKIYDIFDGDSEEERIGKERTKEQFEKGVTLFCMRRFRESRQAFIEVLKNDRKDKGAKRYLRYCNQYYQKESTENSSIFLCEG